MLPDGVQTQAPPIRFFVWLFALGAGLGLCFVLTEAPLWMIYTAPVLALPLLLRELRLLGRQERDQEVGLEDLEIRDVEEFTAALQRLRLAAKEAHSQRELATLRMQLREFERSRLRYERWAIGVSIAWVLVGIASASLALVFSWKGALALIGLPAIGIAVYLLRSAFGEFHRLGPSLNFEFEQDLERQEARVAKEPGVDSLSSSGTRRTRPNSA